VELGHTYGIESVAFSPDAHFVATASGGGPARMWDVKTGREVRTFDSQGPIYAAFSPDGNSMLTVEILDPFGSIHL
jgi:WD40 repeat protein